MLEPLSVSRLRRNPTRDVALLLAHVDALVDEVDRLEVPLTPVSYTHLTLPTKA